MTDEDQQAKEHEELRKTVTELSEAIEERFDKKLSALEQEELPTNHRIEQLQLKYDDISANISIHRRAGKDMFVAHNIIMKFPSLLQMAKATNENQDFIKAEQVLNKAKEEMELSAEKQSINIRKEIELQLDKEKVEENSSKEGDID